MNNILPPIVHEFKAGDKVHFSRDENGDPHYPLNGIVIERRGLVHPIDALPSTTLVIHCGGGQYFRDIKMVYLGWRDHDEK